MERSRDGILLARVCQGFIDGSKDAECIMKAWFEQLVFRALEVTPDVLISVQETADEEDQ
jgi:hypothetical protein